MLRPGPHTFFVMLPWRILAGWLSVTSVAQLSELITVLFWGRICVRDKKTEVMEKCFLPHRNPLSCGKADV